MKNKKGFTLVELLAVIAIIAVLALIAVPNVTKLYKNSKKNAFASEVETIRKEIKKEFVESGAEGEIKTIIASVGDDPIQLSGKEIDYHAELDESGNIKYLEVTNGEFYYQYSNINENIEEKIIEVKDMEKENVVSKIEFLNNNILTENVFVYKNDYEVYDASNIVPVIITNMSDKNIKIQVKYGNAVLSITEKDSAGNNKKEYLIAPETEDDIKFVKLPENIVKSISKGNQNYLQITASIILDEKGEGSEDDIVVSTNYKNKISFTKTKKDVIITSVESNKIDEVFYNQTGIFIPQKTDVGSLTISLKNTSGEYIYKFHDIYRDTLTGTLNDKKYTEVTIEGEELNKYEDYLMQGIYIQKKATHQFEETFSSNQQYIQKIHFNFGKYENSNLYDQNGANIITIASKANHTETTYGDFSVSNDTSHHKNNNYCGTYPHTVCFGDGKLGFNADGLALGKNLETLTLGISQSMNINNTYSVYMTIKPNTISQIGTPAGSYPATILAISQASTIYLSWIGIYNNYLQVYSYFSGSAITGSNGINIANNKATITNSSSKKQNNGFVAFDISDYKDKIMNIQITANRTGSTKVYINGEELAAFESGQDIVDYNIATIGDLRPLRGLKFTGEMYDLALYNTEIPEEAIKTNWEYAKVRWSIN